MGRAIVREPDAFLMDEPLSNLDAKLRVQMRAEIHQLQRRLNTTTIYVTHDQVEAMTMGDRVSVMNAGRLLQVDTPQVLYDRPTTSSSPASSALPRSTWWRRSSSRRTVVTPSPSANIG
jgi:ABC-type sugar transport systems, ATPase components